MGVTCLSSFYRIYLKGFRVKALLNVYSKDDVGVEAKNSLSVNCNGVLLSETRIKSLLISKISKNYKNHPVDVYE